jgi:hypothetical protein
LPAVAEAAAAAAVVGLSIQLHPPITSDLEFFIQFGNSIFSNAAPAETQAAELLQQLFKPPAKWAPAADSGAWRGPCWSSTCRHGFFYRLKYPDIFDISCLSIGADKK